MHVEHSFITTLAYDDYVNGTRATLRSLGFILEMTSDAGIKAVRGAKKAAKAKSVDALPQTVKCNFDRGRVEVAVGVDRRGSYGGALPELQAVLTAQLIEESLKPESLDPQLDPRWLALGADIETHRKRRKRVRMIVWCLVILFFVLGFAGIIAAVNM